MENPFEFGRELGADELVNRVEELAAVEETILSGGKLFVIGPRSFGKTSLLKSAAEKSAAKDNFILRYNAESFPEIGGLVTRIIEDSARALKGTVERVGGQIKNTLAACVRRSVFRSRRRSGNPRSALCLRRRPGKSVCWSMP